MVGPAINQWFLSTTGLNIKLEYIVSGGLTLIGGGELLVAISNSKPARPKLPVVDVELQSVEEEKRSLIRP